MKAKRQMNFTQNDFSKLRRRHGLTWLEVLHYLKRGAHEVACDFEGISYAPIYLQAVALDRDLDGILNEMFEEMKVSKYDN